MAFNKNDINTPEEAREYLNYHGGELTQPEKDIFDDDHLITDKALLQNTAELLNNCKKAEANLVTERTSETGLSTNGNEFLISLMEPRRNNSLAYQLINTKEDGEGKIDKMVKEYQTVLFRKNNKTLDLKLKEALITFAKVSEEEEKVAKEITELEKKYNPQVLQEQTDLEDKVNAAVTALKDDLRIVNTGGCKFLDELVKNGSNIADSCRTIIQTGYNVNGKPYTNRTFLLEDFPIQIITILKDLVKDKLFAYIDSSIKKFRDTKEVKKLRIYVSDIFRVMHTLFPKGSIYKDSPFLKVGNDVSVIGKKYADVSANFFQAHKVFFPYEEKPLTWADVLSKDAVNNEKVHEEAITLYEKKWHLYNPIRYFMRLNYELYVEDFLKNAKDVSGDKLTDSNNVNVITYQETIAIRTLIYFLTDLENEGKLETPLMATEKGYLTKVEQLETARNATLSTYGTWKALGSNFQERLDNWEKNEGRFLEEKGIRTYFEVIKIALEKARQNQGLSSEEEAELLTINNYLTESRLRAENLRNELEKITDILNELVDKSTFFTELKDYLKGKKVPEFPADTADDYAKSDYFFTLSPQHVIGFLVAYHIKHDTSPTEAGIKKYYFEKLAGINHSYSKNEPKKLAPTSKEGF
ncbi:2121_t:CDS:2 [Entrophospora sp. SA101]|nr:2121_t:CDS:2 [Entrophospora sp. SA101]